MVDLMYHASCTLSRVVMFETFQAGMKIFRRRQVVAVFDEGYLGMNVHCWHRWVCAGENVFSIGRCVR